MHYILSFNLIVDIINLSIALIPQRMLKYCFFQCNILYINISFDPTLSSHSPPWLLSLCLYSFTTTIMLVDD
jgi:hypothetical protein